MTEWTAARSRDPKLIIFVKTFKVNKINNKEGIKFRKNGEIKKVKGVNKERKCIRKNTCMDFKFCEQYTTLSYK